MTTARKIRNANPIPAFMKIVRFGLLMDRPWRRLACSSIRFINPAPALLIFLIFLSPFLGWAYSGLGVGWRAPFLAIADGIFHRMLPLIRMPVCRQMFRGKVRHPSRGLGSIPLGVGGKQHRCWHAGSVRRHGPRAVRMHSGMTGVKRQSLKIGVISDFLKQTFPYALIPPPAGAVIGVVPVPILQERVTPRGAGGRSPAYDLEEGPVVRRGPACFVRVAGRRRRQTIPSLAGEAAAAMRRVVPVLLTWDYPARQVVPPT